MATAQLGEVLRHIRCLAADPKANESDGALLRAYLSRNDQAAFEAVLQRHGPMVLRVCRRCLGNHHDAEDAFQATFLVLARQAAAVRNKDSLASWLHGVAYRMAKNAKRAATRRRGREAGVVPTQPHDPALSAAWEELQVLVDEEIGRLPKTVREPFVLCCVENQACAEAARQLGLKEGTVWNRLGRARKLLQERLTRRGIMPPAGLLAALLGRHAASAAVPAGLAASTAQAAVLVGAGQVAGGGLVSTRVAALAEGALKAMSATKLKTAVGLVLAVVLAGTGIGALTYRTLAAAPQRETTRAAEAAPMAKKARAADASGDPLPDGAVARLGTLRLRHGDGIFFASYTPDGKGLLTAGIDGTIRLWDLPTGKELHRFKAGGFCTVALSPDGKVVAAARGGTLYLWNTATGKLLHEVATGQKGPCLAFAGDGKTVLTVSPEREALVWDVESGKKTKQLAKPNRDGRPVMGIAVSPDWKYLASLHSEGRRMCSSVKIKNLAAGRELPEIPVLAEQVCTPNTLAFSADSKLLAWLGLEGAVVLWDVGAHKERLRLDRKGSWQVLSAIALSRDGKSVAVSHQDTVEIWDAGTGKRVASAGEQLGNESPIRQSRAALAFSPDAKELVASFGGPSALRFDVARAKRVAGPGGGHRDPVSLLGLSGDGKTVLTYCRRDPVRGWDLATGREVRQVPIPGNATFPPARSADGQRLAANLRRIEGFVFTDTVTVYDAAGKALQQFDPKGDVESLALSPDGRVLAMRQGPTGVRLWDTTTGKHLVTLAQTQGATLGFNWEFGEAWGLMTLGLAFSPDGRYIVGGKTKRQLALWDSRTGETVWAADLGRQGATERFALSADGHTLATLNTDGTVTLYEAATGQQRARLGKPEEKRGDNPLNEATALAFSPDSRYLATAKAASVIRLWDLLHGQEVGQLKGHQGNVVSLLFAPDSTRLVSGSADTTALIWDVGRMLKAKTAPEAKLDAKALGGLWADLADRDAAKAFAALWKLSASPAQAAALVKVRLRPVATADPKRLATLLADVGSDKFAARRKAEAELEALGALAEPALRKALGSDPGPDLRQRLERLLQRLSGAPFGNLLRELRAVEVLELAGGDDARGVLNELSGGAPEARLTREAKAAAQRLAKRPGPRP